MHGGSASRQMVSGMGYGASGDGQGAQLARGGGSGGAGGHMEAMKLFASVGLSPADLDALAQIPEEDITAETLPHIIMHLKNRKSGLPASSGAFPREAYRSGREEWEGVHGRRLGASSRYPDWDHDPGMAPSRSSPGSTAMQRSSFPIVPTNQGFSGTLPPTTNQGFTGMDVSARTSSRTITLPNNRCIILRQRSKINEIEQTSGARISVADPVEGSVDRQVTITGSPASISLAESLILKSIPDPSYNCKMTIPNKHIGCVNLNEIEQASGAYIDIARPVEGSVDRQITITGLPASVKLADSLILKSLPDSTRTMTIPNSLIGLVIGPQGSKLKEIEQTSGTNIEISDPVEGSVDRQVIVAGSLASISHAESLINIAMGLPDSIRQMSIPSKLIGLVFGPQGSIIKEIQQTSGTRISISDLVDDSDDQQVTITGSPASISQAESRILTILQESTYKMTIPNQLVVGKQGSKIKEIEQTSGTWIQIAPPVEGSVNRQVIITGSPASISQAEFLILQSLPDSTHEMIIPNQLVGLIIGPQGSIIKEIQQKSGAVVRVCEYVNGSVDRLVTICGSPASISQAESLINMALGSTLKMTIPQHMIGLVIGKKGSQLKEIQQKSGARIQIADPVEEGSVDRQVTITGSPASISQAESLINLVIGLPDRTRTMAIPKNLIKLVIGPQGSKLKEIQQKSGTWIEICAPVDGSVDVQVTITGFLANIIQAESLIWHSLPDSTHKMTIPNNLIGLVIGPQGSKIKEIEHTSGAWIQVIPPVEDSVDHQVTITGSPASISQAESLILKSLPDSTRKMAIPNKLIGLVIGKIKEIEQATGAYIDIAPPVEGSVNRQVTISGSPAGISHATSLILKSLPDKVTKLPKSTRKMTIPNNLVWCVIGPQGSIIKEIEQTSGTHIEIVEGSVDLQITITGSLANVSQAESLINAMLPDSYTSPDKLTSP